MSDEKKNFLERLNPLWKGIDLFRRIVVNTVFLIAVVVVFALLMKGDRPQVPDSTALVLSPSGTIVEQLAGGGPSANIQKLMGMGENETLLKDIIDAIDLAKDDPRVKVLVLDLNRMGSTGLTKLQDIKDAIARFKKSGKKVVAYANLCSRDAYYLAAQADEIYLHPMGLIGLEGYGHYVQYYKEGLDKLEVDINIFRVGKFKSAVEPFMRTDMSPEAREANMEWLGDLWNNYLTDVAAARHLTVEALKNYTENMKTNLKEFKGDVPQMALKAKLVDFVAPRDVMDEKLIQMVGKDEKTQSFNQISLNKYLKSHKRDPWGDRVTDDAVGVIIAKGTILDGTQPEGTIGGDSTAKLIREARIDKKIKAIVLRVDSGGGSAFASEIIRRELELARKDGKIIVISMGSVAASGGYWISTASDEIWAYPSTITGSIGIFGMYPTFQKPLAKYLGIHADGVTTNRLAGLPRFDRQLDPEVAEMAQEYINKGYIDFLTRVATARKMTIEQVDEIAQGRVWSGQDAHHLGLVDKLGNLDDALKSAAKMAKLPPSFKVKYFHKKESFQEKMMNQFFSDPSETETETYTTSSPMNGFLRFVSKEMEILTLFNDPKGVYAYCPIRVE